MIKTVNENELTRLNENLLYLKSIVLNKKNKLFKPKNMHKEMIIANLFDDSNDDNFYVEEIMFNLAQLLGDNLIECNMIDGGLIEDDEYYNCDIYNKEDINDLLEDFNMPSLLDDIDVMLEYVEIGFYIKVDHKYIKEYLSLFKEDIVIKNIFLSYISRCRDYYYTNYNQFDRAFGDSGIDIGFNKKDSKILIISDFQVNIASIGYGLCKMLIYMKEKIDKYYREELSICQMYHYA